MKKRVKKNESAGVIGSFGEKEIQIEKEERKKEKK